MQPCFAHNKNLETFAEPYLFPINKQIPKISTKFIILTYSLSTDFNFALRPFVGVCLNEDFNSSIHVQWKFRYSQPYEIVMSHHIYLEELQDLRNLSQIFQTFNRQIFSERGLFFWLSDFYNDTDLTQISLDSLHLKLLPSVVIGAPSISFSAEIISTSTDTNLQNKVYTCLWSGVWSFFKSQQWNSQGRRLHALVLVRLDTPKYFQAFPHDTYVCLRLVPFRSNYSLHCTWELMATLYMSIVHNVTLLTYDRTRPEEIEGILQIADNIEYFLTRTVGPIDPVELPGHNTRARMYSSFHDMFPIYCELKIVKKEPGSDLLVWTLGFVPALWVQSLIGFTLLAWLYNKQAGVIKKFGFKEMETIFMTFVGTVTRQALIREDIKDGRMIGLLILWFAEVILIMYENSIVSVVTVPPPPTVMKTLPDALKAGFKFMWDPNDYTGVTFEAFFGPEFKMLGVYELYKNSYIFANWGIFWTKQFIEEKLLFAAFNDNLEPNMALIQSAGEMSGYHKKGVAICHLIPDSVHKLVNMFEMHVSNRYWLLLTAARIHASGLIEKWEDWANLAYLLNLDAKDEEESKDELNKESAIDLDKFLIPCYCFVIFYFVSGGVFIVEMIWGGIVKFRDRTKIVW